MIYEINIENKNNYSYVPTSSLLYKVKNSNDKLKYLVFDGATIGLLFSLEKGVGITTIKKSLSKFYNINYSARLDNCKAFQNMFSSFYVNTILKEGVKFPLGVITMYLTEELQFEELKNLCLDFENSLLKIHIDEKLEKY